MPLDLPTSLVCLLSLFRPCFTAPSFATFSGLALGFLARVGRHTVTGCLQAAGLAGLWHHARAPLLLAGALVAGRARPLPARARGREARARRRAAPARRRRHPPSPLGQEGLRLPLALRRRGEDEAGPALGLGQQLGLPRRRRPASLPRPPLCLPVLFRLWRPKQPRRTKPWLARELVELVASRYPGRRLEVVADAAYAAQALASLPENVTVTARLRRDAALFGLAPPRAGKRGRPRTKGERLPSLSQLADDPGTEWQTVAVSRYGHSAEVRLHGVRCLCYGVFAGQEVTVVLAREEKTTAGFDLALVSSDTEASAPALVERYARRWAIEVCFQEAKQLAGVGEAQNRTREAVERTAPFGFLCLSLAVVWYALFGHAPADVHEHRARAPRYRTKAHPSLADMLAKLRREIIAAQFRAGRPSGGRQHEKYPRPPGRWRRRRCEVRKSR